MLYALFLSHVPTNHYTFPMLLSALQIPRIYMNAGKY